MVQRFHSPFATLLIATTAVAVVLGLIVAVFNNGQRVDASYGR